MVDGSSRKSRIGKHLRPPHRHRRGLAEASSKYPSPQRLVKECSQQAAQDQSHQDFSEHHLRTLELDCGASQRLVACAAARRSSRAATVLVIE
jgi:hypothetical protein